MVRGRERAVGVAGAGAVGRALPAHNRLRRRRRVRVRLAPEAAAVRVLYTCLISYGQLLAMLS